MRLEKSEAEKKDVAGENGLPRPRFVDDHSDEAEDGSEELSGKNPEYYEENEDQGSTEEIIRGKKLGRSNSEVYKRKISSPITPAERNTTEDANNNSTEMKDMVIISVISLEAAPSHFKGFLARLRNGLISNSWVKGIVDEDIKTNLAKNVNYTTQESYANAFSEILKNKEPGHCVPVLEGLRESMPKNFEAQCSSGKKFQYVLNSFYIDGQNGRKDARQNMHFYLRADVQQIFSINKAIIPCENGKSFAAAEIMFSTIDKQKFSILVVHIPNDFVRTIGNCENTKKGILEYAEKRKREGVIVIAYLGDTNYKEPIQAHSCPSLGGNQEKNYLSLTASGAKNYTYFMQAISLAKDDRIRVLQPSVLNVVNLVNTKEKIDHPSIQCQALLKSPLQNREPRKKPGVFEERRTKSAPDLDIKESGARKGLTF